MAWPAAGVWDGLTIQALGEIIPALIRGVNERREAIGLTPVAFATSGSDMTYPESSDYDGFAFDEGYVDLLEAIWDEVLGLVEDAPAYGGSIFFATWFVDDTFETEIDVPYLESLSGDPPSEVRSDTRIYERIRNGLDALLYIRHVMPVGENYTPSTITRSAISGPGDPVPTIAEAFAGRFDFSDGDEGESLFLGQQEGAKLVAPDTYISYPIAQTAVEMTVSAGAIDASELSGDLARADILFLAQGTTYAFTVLIETPFGDFETPEINAALSYFTTQTFENLGTAAFSLGEDHPMTLSMVDNGDDSPLPSNDATQTLFFKLMGVALCVDLSSILTDQI